MTSKNITSIILVENVDDRYRSLGSSNRIF